MPAITSTRIARTCTSPTAPRSPCSRSSSTSSLHCQKNRYGEIVVPRIAMIPASSGLSSVIDGTNVRRATSPQSTRTANSTTTYVPSDSVSHRRTLE